MKNNAEEITQIYCYPERGDVEFERKIAIKKFLSEIAKVIRLKTKRETCWICGESCSSFCHSHSIPAFVLKNISEKSEVSAPRQAFDLEPLKSTGVASAGLFYNICNDCDGKVFTPYEDERRYDTNPSDEMMAAIALKNCLKVIYERSLEIEEEMVMDALVDNLEIVVLDKLSPAQYAVKEFERELGYALQSICENLKGRYHLCFYRKLDYVVPYAAQYPIAMLTDLKNNVINNYFSGRDDYELEYLHIAVLPLKESTVILIFSKSDERRHEEFFQQLEELDDLDQLSVINFLTFTGADNVFVNKSTYTEMIQNEFFAYACRLTYSVRSNVPNPTDPLGVAMRAHSFENRKYLPNLLSPEYSLSHKL